VAYFVAAVVPIDVAARQELLELDPVSAKLRRLVDLLQRELAVRELGRKITTETEERLTKKQREYYLREQLRSIQKELGDEQERGSEGASSAAASRRRACPTRRSARRSASSAGSRGSRRHRRNTA
jgi:ATP-dependent Lon protease